jgi:hypothetical protein
MGMRSRSRVTRYVRRDPDELFVVAAMIERLPSAGVFADDGAGERVVTARPAP